MIGACVLSDRTTLAAALFGVGDDRGLCWRWRFILSVLRSRWDGLVLCERLRSSQRFSRGAACGLRCRFATRLQWCVGLLSATSSALVAAGRTRPPSSRARHWRASRVQVIDYNIPLRACCGASNRRGAADTPSAVPARLCRSAVLRTASSLAGSPNTPI